VTSIQTLSNFLLDIRLEQPETVIVDDAAATLWRLHDAVQPVERIDDLAAPAHDSPAPIPDFVHRGVCTYTPDTGELFLFARFGHERIDGRAADALESALEGRVEPVRELSMSVDAYNGFDARVPPRAVCESTAFDRFERWVDYDDAGRIDVGSGSDD